MVMLITTPTTPPSWPQQAWMAPAAVDRMKWLDVQAVCTLGALNGRGTIVRSLTTAAT